MGFSDYICFIKTISKIENKMKQNKTEKKQSSGHPQLFILRIFKVICKTVEFYNRGEKRREGVKAVTFSPYSSEQTKSDSLNCISAGIVVLSIRIRYEESYQLGVLKVLCHVFHFEVLLCCGSSDVAIVV